MGLMNTVRVCTLLVICANSVPALADKSLDDELEAEWGDKRIKTTTVAAPKDRYMARLKLIEGRRDFATERCKTKAEGARYCMKHVNEDYNHDLRRLDKEFESQLDEIPKPHAKPKGFGRR